MKCDITPAVQRLGKVCNHLVVLAEEVPFRDQQVDQTPFLDVLVIRGIGMKLLNEAKVDGTSGPAVDKTTDLSRGDLGSAHAVWNVSPAQHLPDFSQSGWKMSQEDNRLTSCKMI